MTAQKTYPPGVPCWVEALDPNPQQAAAFYSALFGWEASAPGPMPDGGAYIVARLHGEDVAGIATLPASGIAEPAWTTYVCVDALETTVQRVTAAGGSAIVAPLNASPAGRLAIVATPGGASFGLWEPQQRHGAQRINEASAWAMSALMTPDLDGAAAFFANAFCWSADPFDAGGARALLFRLAGYVGGLPQQPVPRDVVAVAIEDSSLATERWSVDFWIADVDAAAGRVAAHGGRVIAPPSAAPPFRRAVIAAPGGAVCSISQLVDIPSAN